MKKFFRKLRNVIWSKKHDKLVETIYLRQLKARPVRNRLAKLNQMSTHGILGDRLLDEQILCSEWLKYHCKKTEQLKEKYKSSKFYKTP